MVLRRERPRRCQFPGRIMLTRAVLIVSWLGVAEAVCQGDEVLYRYEGDVLPYDPSAGWEIFNPCEDLCSASVEDGHFVLRFTGVREAGANYNLVIAQEPEQPPPTLWIEWRFRSNHPLGPNFFSSNAFFNQPI